jgi:hypothetical protein
LASFLSAHDSTHRLRSAPPRSAWRRAASNEGKWSDQLFTTVERTWEADGMTPNHVIHQDGTLKMWYRATGENGVTYVAYAESNDGFTWRRPDLGLVDYCGSKANNLLHEEEYFGL